MLNKDEGFKMAGVLQSQVRRVWPVPDDTSKLVPCDANPRYAGEFAGGLCKETGSNPDGSIQQYHGDVGQDFAMIRSKDGRFHHEIRIDTIKDTVKFGGNCNQHEGGLI